MESVTQSKFIDIFRKKAVTLFSINDLEKFFGSKSPVIYWNLVKRLQKSNVIRSLIRGKYEFLFAAEKAGDYEIANYLVNPSYISLETALSYYEIIDQFPYTVTSVTIKKARAYEIGPKSYGYAKIATDLFFDYQKQDNFLIATKQKAVLDYLYLAFRGKRSRNNISLMRFDRSILTKKEIGDYILQHMGKNKSFLKFCRHNNIL